MTFQKFSYRKIKSLFVSCHQCHEVFKLANYNIRYQMYWLYFSVSLTCCMGTSVYTWSLIHIQLRFCGQWWDTFNVWTTHCWARLTFIKHPVGGTSSMVGQKKIISRNIYMMTGTYSKWNLFKNLLSMRSAKTSWYSKKNVKLVRHWQTVL